MTAHERVWRAICLLRSSLTREAPKERYGQASLRQLFRWGGSSGSSGPVSYQTLSQGDQMFIGSCQQVRSGNQVVAVGTISLFSMVQKYDSGGCAHFSVPQAFFSQVDLPDWLLSPWQQTFRLKLAGCAG